MLERLDRAAVLAVLLVVLLAAGAAHLVSRDATPGRIDAGSAPAASPGPGAVELDAAPTVTKAAPALPPYPKILPHGETSIFGDNRFLVAYYGTAGTGVLGVLGETDPDTAFRRLARAAAPFAREHSAVQPVYELIATVVDSRPGADGSYSHDIARQDVARYIRAAHRHDALLLLDIQPGRTDFLTAAKRWGWALHDPCVGLAVDPEWRMGRHQIPAQVVGSVGAPELNRTSAWLHTLVARNHLPQKLFLLHEFRTSMVSDIGAVKRRAGLVDVQHIDGYGTPGQKLDTYRTVARHDQFVMGFKLFYDEDVHRMSAADVRRIRPKVRFVSFQ